MSAREQRQVASDAGLSKQRVVVEAVRLAEQVPRPVDDREQRPVAVGSAPVSPAQQREAVVEAVTRAANDMIGRATQAYRLPKGNRPPT